MKTLLRIAPLALVALPLLSHAQRRTGSVVGLEIPASAPPRQGHFLTGAYLLGTYAPQPTASGLGYTMQPYVRYQLGNGLTGRWRPFVQYTFAPYRVSAYGAAQRYEVGGGGLPTSWGGPSPAAGYSLAGSASGPRYGSLGAFSVGIPMQAGRSSAVLNMSSSVVEGLLWGLLR